MPTSGGWHHHVPRDRRAHDHGVRCAGTICDGLKVVGPPVQRQIVLEMGRPHARECIAVTTLQPAGPWCSETSWTKRHDTWAHAIASCSGSGGNPLASDRRRILDSRDRNGARRERDEGQGMRGVSTRCLRVTRGTCGAQERTIETRGDPVVQGADEDSWARAVDLEATLLGGNRCGAALHCHSALHALFVGQKDWFLIPPHGTTLSMIAEKFSSLFITS